MHFPRGVEVIVSALIRNDRDEILLVRQPKWGDVWTLPGGHLEPGESLAEAALREGEEETGLRLELERLVRWGELIDPDGRTRPIHFLTFDFAFRARGSILRPDPAEIAEARWVQWSEVPAYDIVDGHRQSIETFARSASQST